MVAFGKIETRVCKFLLVLKPDFVNFRRRNVREIKDRREQTLRFFAFLFLGGCNSVVHLEIVEIYQL